MRRTRPASLRAITITLLITVLLLSVCLAGLVVSLQYVQEGDVAHAWPWTILALVTGPLGVIGAFVALRWLR